MTTLHLIHFVSLCFYEQSLFIQRNLNLTIYTEMESRVNELMIWGAHVV